MNEQRQHTTEKLNEYIRIAYPGIVAMLGALILVTAALLIWGFTGEIAVTATETGTVSGEDPRAVLCFVDVSEGVRSIAEGSPAAIRMPDGTSVRGTVRSMSEFPLSREEILGRYQEADGQEGFSPWVLQKVLGDSSFSYELQIESEDDLSDYLGDVADVTAVVRTEPPISAILG